MYFKNKVTGVIWHITDKTHQRLLQSDKGYSKVSNVNVQDKFEKDNSEPIRDLDNEKVEKFTKLSWGELRSLASEKGINPHGLKREKIEEQLREIGDIDVTK